MRQDRAGELLEQANASVEKGDVSRAEMLLSQLERVSAQAHGIEELRQRIELARLYGGFAPGDAVRETLQRGGNAPELVVLPAGRFRMGSPSNEADRKKNEGPQHSVVFERGFAMARTEVTVAQFESFVQATGYVSSAERAGRSTIYDERTGSMTERARVDWHRDYSGRRAEPDLPVVHVSWEDAKAYADWLSRETGATYRLPTEAEFEYAVRAGSQSRYPWGDGNPERLVGNLTGERDRSQSMRAWSNAFPDYADGFWGAAPVHAFQANAFGLHDTEGNVSEWVEDCWHDGYARAPNDGTAWVNPGCKARVIRGASWASAPDQARSAFRISAAPGTTNARVGFRVARDL
jgi:formylglycine-generating enzyme required for sulfatase activity